MEEQQINGDCQPSAVTGAGHELSLSSLSPSGDHHTIAALLELAERCEKAEGPDRELDVLVHAIVNNAVAEWQEYSKGWSYHRGGSWVSVGQAKPYTASLDAAMMLVDPGCGVRIDRYWLGEGPRWMAALSFGGIPSDPRRVYEAWDAHSPALALTAACLRARNTPNSQGLSRSLRTGSLEIDDV